MIGLHSGRRQTSGEDRPCRICPDQLRAEDDGVVWMFEKRRLARIDLRLPQRLDAPARALITSVELSSSSREVFNPSDSLGSLSYSDNSLVFDFAAPANPFGPPITFEVLLEGAGTQWISTGGVGSAPRFNRC